MTTRANVRVLRALEPTNDAYAIAKIAGNYLSGQLIKMEALANGYAEAIALGPDAVTIYQMEVPYNTTIYKEMKAAGKLIAPVADWPTSSARAGPGSHDGAAGPHTAALFVQQP